MRYEVKHEKLKTWVDEIADLCRPEKVHWCDGSREEYDLIVAEMVQNGNCIPLEKRPRSILFRSDPSDVARVEDRTYISTRRQIDAGPTNNWIDPHELKNLANDPAQQQRIAGLEGDIGEYAVAARRQQDQPPRPAPAHIGAPRAVSYVVCNMIVMTRVSPRVIELLGEDGEFIPCLHSVGAPLAPGQKDVPWPCAPMEQKYISHFPDEDLIWSFGSGYGGNALLGKKCLALRIASAMARREGWMAEHMLILRLTNPAGRQFHIAAAFPSACGKTNLAMLQPTIEGWKCECIGDDIAWMKIGPDGRLYAINPENGFFGVAPGTSYDSNPMAMDTLHENIIFTNCALTDDGDIWWEGMDGAKPAHAIDWKGRDWTPDCSEPAANPNARFTAPAAQCPIICPDWEKPEGVPIDIFVFGGRRAGVVPLVNEAYNWDHGVFLGATASSETTAANIGAVGNLRRDPFAMKPFCGYNMGDYFQHWCEMGDRLGGMAPRIFYVNWFRKDDSGRFLWPGFGENSRVLKWMCERVEGRAGARATPIGYLPEEGALDLEGLDIPPADMAAILDVDVEAWRAELPDIARHFEQFGEKLPERMQIQLDELARRLV